MLALSPKGALSSSLRVLTLALSRGEDAQDQGVLFPGRLGSTEWETRRSCNVPPFL